jgi:hypothetical protein
MKMLDKFPFEVGDMISWSSPEKMNGKKILREEGDYFVGLVLEVEKEKYRDGPGEDTWDYTVLHLTPGRDFLTNNTGASLSYI